MKFSTLILFTVCLFFSCSKTDFSEQRNIANWTKDISPEIKERFDLRLAFGKSLAAALREEELRQYIKEKSIVPNENIYAELVFGMIKDDVLPSGKTVAQVIKQYEDAEVKELFGEGLQDILSQEDPMMAIKIPDIFHQLDWNTNDVIPFVGVETPQEIEDKRYVFYYFNGYHELLSEFNTVEYTSIKYFYIALKYSSDHLYLNVNDLTNEKNISLYEFLPQILNCDGSVLGDILSSGIRDKNTQNKIYLNKMKGFDIWQNKCGYTGDFGLVTQPCGQSFFCPRDCAPDNPLNKNVILTGFDLRNNAVLFSLGYFFVESYHFSFTFFSTDYLTMKRVVVPAYRFAKLSKSAPEVTLHIKEIDSGGHCFKVPEVSVKNVNRIQKREWIPINARIFDDMTQTDRYYFCVSIMYYNDIVNSSFVVNNNCPATSFDQQIPLGAEHYLGVFADDYSWCTHSEGFHDRVIKVGLVY
jgi:hypothetical protein